MAKQSRKKQPAVVQPKQPSRRWLHTLLFPRLRVVLALAVVLLLGGGMQMIWRAVAPSILHREPYLLTAERIAITPQPEWITSDVRGEVVRNAGLDGRLSILDDGFMTVVEDAFVLHPWVESVASIAKTYPAGVRVELNYRKPVAVVEMSGPDGMLLIPIDGKAVHLPQDDVPDVFKHYLPRIQNVVNRPPVGQPWDDPRVVGAADLAQRLSADWDDLLLVDILPSSRPEIFDEQRYFVYDLMTKGGTRVVWGASPLAAPPGEADFGAKLERLRQCIGEYGPLDTVLSPAVVDVRNGLTITPRTVKKPEVEPRTANKDQPSDGTTPVVK
jgi:hypothetical protein